jgi:hypothetical protein
VPIRLIVTTGPQRPTISRRTMLQSLACGVAAVTLYLPAPVWEVPAIGPWEITYSTGTAFQFVEAIRSNGSALSWEQLIGLFVDQSMQVFFPFAIGFCIALVILHRRQQRPQRGFPVIDAPRGK